MNKERVRFRRPCKTCGKMFIPSGKSCKLCNKCYDLARDRIKK